MAGVKRFPAQPPALPSKSASSLQAPDFEDYAVALQEVQDAKAKLQEVVSSGRRLAYIACARLQRCDLEGATLALQAIERLPSLAEAAGGLWANLDRRLQLCWSCGVGGFLEVYIQTLAFQKFLETGQLLPQVPTKWLTEIQDFDNECFLMGAISGLRELERYAVGRGEALDIHSVHLCLQLGQSLEEALMQFNFRNSALRQRFDGVKYAVKKLESLEYEINLARQRALADERQLPEDQLEAPSGDAPSLDVAAMAVRKLDYDAFDERREQVMKQSRDVVKAAKNAIYALQRDDWKRADSQIQLCADKANEIYADFASTSPTLRLGFFSGALEEMAEALAYRAFRRDKKLLSATEMQAISSLKFDLLLAEYLGGVMDLTGEVGRFAIRSASQGRSGKEAIKSCLACVEVVYDGVSILPYVPSSLSKKIGPLKSTMSKIEQVLYELALLSGGLKASWDDPPPDSNAE